MKVSHLTFISTKKHNVDTHGLVTRRDKVSRIPHLSDLTSKEMLPSKIFLILWWLNKKPAKGLLSRETHSYLTTYYLLIRALMLLSGRKNRGVQLYCKICHFTLTVQLISPEMVSVTV